MPKLFSSFFLVLLIFLLLVLHVLSDPAPAAAALRRRPEGASRLAPPHRSHYRNFRKYFPV